jgi:hypothetical protein
LQLEGGWTWLFFIRGGSGATKLFFLKTPKKLALNPNFLLLNHAIGGPGHLLVP